MRNAVSPYHRHRFSAEIISHSVWLYFRFALIRGVEERLAARGVSLSYETIRVGCLKFDQAYVHVRAVHSLASLARLNGRISRVCFRYHPTRMLLLASPYSKSTILRKIAASYLRGGKNIR